MKAIITDIEGTTTSIRFVFEVLFPYAKEHLAEFVYKNQHGTEVRSLLDDVVEIASIDDDIELIVQQLLQWIDEDKKITPLKALQGMIWQKGYEQGDFKGHIYPDVEPVLRKWNEQGIKLYVYSSGSIAAQKLIFGYSDVGDLTALFTNYFDTHVGNKRQSTSYQRILTEIGSQATDVLFLSDIEEELDAAKSVGMNTLQLIRDNTEPSKNHNSVRSFKDIQQFNV